MKSFLLRFGSLVSFVLSGFDRLRFWGEARLLNNARGVDSYLYRQQIRYVDFPRHAANLTKTLCVQTEQQAQEAGVPLQHLNSPTIDKEAAARQLAHRHARTAGRVALLTSVELCSVYRLRKNETGWIKPVKERGKCLHYYHYFLHPELGLCYVRVQSWFPFAIRVGLNGRQWLYRQLEQRGVPFQKRHNLLCAVADPALAQELLDQQRRTDWPSLLAKLVQPLQPLWSYLHGPAGAPYYWMTEQSEWATDFVFQSPLATWYRRWLKHGLDTLQCQDVLRYFGKKAPRRCQGEAKIDYRQRDEGARLKFWYESNSLKIYDKEARVLRIETTINQPYGFQVYRTKEGAAADAAPSWRVLRKGVADLDRRAEVSHAANNRLAESLATVAEPRTLGELLKPLGRPVVDQDGRRRARALNPLTGADGTLLRSLAQGDYLLKGFRNRDIRLTLHGDSVDVAERRRQAAAVTRQLALLRAHGLIVKVLQSYRYQLSAAGRRIVTCLQTAQASDVSRLAECG
jgi:hypothetical protein